MGCVLKNEPFSASLCGTVHGPRPRRSIAPLSSAKQPFRVKYFIACGTYLVQRHTISGEMVLASLPLGLGIMSFLWVNEFPDARADAAAGKPTLVVRLGRPAAARAFVGIVATAYASLLLLPFAGLPLGVWGGFLGLPAEIIPAQGATLVSFVLMAVGVALGLWLSG